MNYFSKQTLIDCNLFNSFQFHPIDTFSKFNKDLRYYRWLRYIETVIFFFVRKFEKCEIKWKLINNNEYFIK